MGSRPAGKIYLVANLSRGVAAVNQMVKLGIQPAPRLALPSGLVLFLLYPLFNRGENKGEEMKIKNKIK